MPFLFVDYDQGAGGEFFCAKLSQSIQCVPLSTTLYENGRSKTQDLFGQEFLKPVPTPEYIESHIDLYDLVPAHRSCHIAQAKFGKINSIRISNPPEDSDLWKYLIHQRVKKVLLARQPEDKYFIGELQVLINKTNNKDFVRRVNKNMDNLTLQMLADNIEPTEENRQCYLAKLLTQQPEPIFDYNLVIPYYDLFYNTTKIKQQIKEVFNIDITNNWLETYQQKYETYTKST
jgi:hypothetical protein